MKSIRLFLFASATLVGALATAPAVLAQGNRNNQPAMSQSPDSLPAPFLRYPTLPPFELKGINGTTIKRDELPKRKGTILMFFSPDCHHCQVQTEWLKEAYAQFSSFNLVFATYQSLEELKQYFDKYRLGEWENLYIGRDEKFFLPPYFKMTNLPFIALYDKKGRLITTFQGTTKTDTLLQGFLKRK